MKLKLSWDGVNGAFWSQNYCASSKLGIHSKDFLKFCTLLKEAKRHMKMISMNFLKKSCLGQMSYFGLKLARTHNS